MSALTRTFLPTPAAFLRSAGGFLISSLGRVAKRVQQRGEIRRLAEFDDRMLSDIGVTRSEVVGALAEPFFRDRAVFLVRWDERTASATRQRPAAPVRPSVRRFEFGSEGERCA